MLVQGDASVHVAAAPAQQQGILSPTKSKFDLVSPDNACPGGWAVRDEVWKPDKPTVACSPSRHSNHIVWSSNFAVHVQLGKMRVYRSGKVKLQLGDVVFDMAQGIPSEVRPPMQLPPAVQPPCWGSHPSFPFCALFKLHGPDATHATGMRRLQRTCSSGAVR